MAITGIGPKQLANAYKMSNTTFHSYLLNHRDHLNMLATTRKCKGKNVKSRSYNSDQLEYIINKIFGDTPEGYDFNGKTLIKINN